MTEDKPLILIIDDEKNTSRTMSMALEAAGYQTIESDSAAQGLGLAFERHPQLIILDYKMPDMDGLETLRSLRKDAWGKDAAVIIASNVYDVDIVNSIIELGVQDYVLKVDVNLDEIVELARSYVPLTTSDGPADTAEN